MAFGNSVKDAKNRRGGGAAPGKGAAPGRGGAKPGGIGGSKPGLGGSKTGSKGSGFGAGKTAKPGGAKPGGGLGGAKPGGGLGGAKASGSKPGGMFGAKSAAKPGSSGGMMGKQPAKPGGLGGAAKPGGSGLGAKPGAMGAKPGAMGAKPGAMGAKPGAMGAKPGAMGAKPGAMGAKPGAMGAKPGAMGAKPGATGAVKPGMAKQGSVGGLGAKAGAAKSGIGAMAANKAAAAAATSSAVRTAVALKTTHDVARGLAPNKGGNGGTGRGGDRDEQRLLRNASAGGGAVSSGGMSRNIALSQMDRIDITKMSPRELMMMERQYGSGWLKTLAPTQFSRLQSAGGAGGLTTNTPTALSSHMDPRLLQAASGITGTALLAQMSTQQSTSATDPENSESDTAPDSQSVKLQFDASALATHPEQIEGMVMDLHYPGDQGPESQYYGEEERVPAELMRAKLIDSEADSPSAPPPTVEMGLLDGTGALPPPLPAATPAPPPLPLLHATSAPVPQAGAASPAVTHQSSAPVLLMTPQGPVMTSQGLMMTSSAPPHDELDSSSGQCSDDVPGYSANGYEMERPSNHYGENLYNQQPGYDPLQEQYHMSAPLLDRGDHYGYGPPPVRYNATHKSYYYFSQSPDKYSFAKAIQNYDQTGENDGMYCYSCVMFLGVLMIGVGIIMVIVELFNLFGKHEDMPIAIAGGGVLALGIIILAASMLLWRRRRTVEKKKAIHV